jgi:uncharacterized protein (TIGR00369 family)
MAETIFQKMMDEEIPLPRVAQTLGSKIKNVDSEGGTISIEYDGKPDFTNPMGNIQGGIMAAMLDDTMALALMATLENSEFAPTLEMKINFIAPAVPGALLGQGRVVSKGNRVCVVEGELFQNQDLVARSTATAIIKKDPEEHHAN